MPLWFSVSHSLWSHNSRDCSLPHSHANRSKALPAQAAGRSRDPSFSFCSLSALADCLPSSTTAHTCTRNIVSLWGEVLWWQQWFKVFSPSPATHFLFHTATQGCHCFASTIRWTVGNNLKPLLSKGSPQEAPAFAEAARDCRLAPFTLLSRPGAMLSLSRNQDLCKEGSQNCSQDFHLYTSLWGMVSPLCLSSFSCSEALKKQRERKKKKNIQRLV